MNCLTCNSTNIKKDGKYKFYQKYRCKNCHTQFSERSFSFFHRHRFPEEIIKFCILQMMFISTRMTKFTLDEVFQFKTSHVTIYNWNKKFAHLLSKLQRSKGFSNVWHVDEKFVKVRGSKDKFAYLWVVIDDKNNIIAVNVSESRDTKSAKQILNIAKLNADKPPDIIVTDSLQAYKKACKSVFGRKTKHKIRHFETKAAMNKGRIYYLSNNRIESLNSKINLWYKKFRGFKRLDTANLWCKMWMYFYNLMRPRNIIKELISIHQIIK